MLTGRTHNQLKRIRKRVIGILNQLFIRYSFTQIKFLLKSVAKAHFLG